MTWSRNASESPTLPATGTVLPTPSHSHNVSITHSRSLSSDATRSSTRQRHSRSSFSVSQTFYLPPCTWPHLIVLAGLRTFALTLTASQIANVGINDTVLNSSDPGRMGLVPLLMRHRNLSAFPMLVQGSALRQRTNPQGFGRFGGALVNISFLEPSMIQVAMSPLPDYTIATDEQVLLAVTFEAIDFCNRSAADPALGVPAETALVSLTVIAPAASAKAIVGIASTSIASAAVVAGDPATASAMQSLAVIGLMYCSSTSSQQMTGSVAALSLFRIGSGYVGVLNGNLVFVLAVTGLQLLAVCAVALRSRSAPSWRFRKAAGEACQLVLFPSVPLIAVQVVYQGTVFAAYQLVSSAVVLGVDSTDPEGGVTRAEVAYAVIVAIACTAMPIVYALASWFLLPRQFSSYEYDFAAIPFWKRPFLLRGEVDPLHMRKMFGAITTLSCRKEPIFVSLSMLLPLCLSILSVINPASSTGCVVVFGAATFAFLLFVAVVAYFRPFKAPIVDGFVGLTALVFSGLISLEMRTLLFTSSSGGSDGSRQISGAASSLVFIQMVLQITRTFATIAMFAINRTFPAELRQAHLSWEIFDQWPNREKCALGSDAIPGATDDVGNGISAGVNELLSDFEGPLLLLHQRESDDDDEEKEEGEEEMVQKHLEYGDGHDVLIVGSDGEDVGDGNSEYGTEKIHDDDHNDDSQADMFQRHLLPPEQKSIIRAARVASSASTRKRNKLSVPPPPPPTLQAKKKEEEGFFSYLSNVMSS